MHYVDGFLLAVPKKNLRAYRIMAKKAGAIWREYGALDYKECVADDLKAGGQVSFPKSVKLKSSEVVMFSYIVYKSRAQRDSIMSKVMKDPRIAGLCNQESMPFDMKRMLYGGFKVIVDA